MARLAVMLLFLAAACGDDDNAADRLGVGAECTGDAQCDESVGAKCLQFKGGYCGLAGCAHDTDCPTGSVCIAHDDGQNYCFRQCASKPDCNHNRSVDNEANCSSTASFVDGAMGRKACVPPSGI